MSITKPVICRHTMKENAEKPDRLQQEKAADTQDTHAKSFNVQN